MRAREGAWVIAAMLSVGPAAAEDAPRGTERRIDESLGASVNALGLQHALDLSWTRRLSSSPKPLLADAHASVGFTHYVTPSYTRLGAWVEVSPLSILDLRAGVEPGAYFGTFGNLIGFRSYQDPFNDNARDVRKSEARAGTGSRLYLSPTLKIRVGGLVAASSAEVEWWRSSAAGPLYYEPARDTLLKSSGDRLLTASSAVLWERDLGGSGKVSCGLSHRLTYVFAAPANRSQSLGVVAIRQFGSGRSGFRSPRVAGQVSYYLDNPSRKGQLAAVVGVSVRLAR